MHRVRQSLMYYEKFGWEPVVVAVDPQFIEGEMDFLLLKTIPAHIRIIHVSAFHQKFTRKFGLGSLALRSLLHYFFRVNTLLRQESFDLVFFSTTQFPLLILGNYWQRVFKVPYVIDFQDPWHSDYYEGKPKAERPPKYWFSYYLNKFLEPIALRRVAAIISVSESYSQTLQSRYKWIKPEICHTLTFGAYTEDLSIANSITNYGLIPPPHEGRKYSAVYVGRGGYDMHKSIGIIFRAFKIGLEQDNLLFSSMQLYFIGTSYAPKGKGEATIVPLAQKYSITSWVIEETDRVDYFSALKILLSADMLIVPGSDDSSYTASKIYPYILTKKPILAVFHENSSVVEVLNESQSGFVHTFNSEDKVDDTIIVEVYNTWKNIIISNFEEPETNWTAFQKHLAEEKTKVQVAIFNQARKI